MSPEQAAQDLERLLELVRRRLPEDGQEIRAMLERYLRAPPPKKNERWRLGYRLRRLFTERWELWPALTLYRTWKGDDGERLDGTNNACERAMGHFIKERSRTMRGYKRVESAVGVSRLLAWCGNQLDCGGADLSVVVI